MSFEAKVASNGKYHEADVEVISDSRNWPRPKKQQQNQEEVIEATKNEDEAVVENDSDDVKK